MAIEEDLVNVINEKQDYSNFSEEVKIINRTKVGEISIYTVRNKNGVTFQKVPGNPGIQDRGIMGYTNGDRARPIILSGTAAVSETNSDADDAGLPVVDLEQNKCDVDVSYVQTGPFTINLTMQYQKLFTVAETDKRGYHIDFGNGHEYYTESSNSNPHVFEYQYNNPGTYSVKVSAWAHKVDTAEIGDITIPPSSNVVGATIGGALQLFPTPVITIAPSDFTNANHFATEQLAWDDFEAKDFGSHFLNTSATFLLSESLIFDDEFWYLGRRKKYTIDLSLQLVTHPNILVLSPFETNADTAAQVNADQGNRLAIKVNGESHVSVLSEPLRWRSFSIKNERINNLGVVTSDNPVNTVLFTDSNDHLNQLTPVPASKSPQTGHVTNDRRPVYVPFHCKSERTILVTVN